MLTHEARYRILYRDIDSMGVLYYGRYLALFEIGRVEWLRSEGCRYRDLEIDCQIILPVTQAQCLYQASLHYDDEAIIHTWIEAWSGTTLRFGHRIESAESGRVCATGEVELACIGQINRRPQRLPQILADLMKKVAPDRSGRRRQAK
jgi:acyl-CoA thioester hydrolase